MDCSCFSTMHDKGGSRVLDDPQKSVLAQKLFGAIAVYGITRKWAHSYYFGAACAKEDELGGCF